MWANRLSGVMGRLDRGVFEVTVVAFPNPSGGPSAAVRAAVGLPPAPGQEARLDARGRDAASGVAVGSTVLRGGPRDALLELDTLDLRGVRKVSSAASLIQPC